MGGKRDRSSSDPRERRPASPPASFLGRKRHDSSDEEDEKPSKRRSKSRSRSGEKSSRRRERSNERSRGRGRKKRSFKKSLKPDGRKGKGWIPQMQNRVMMKNKPRRRKKQSRQILKQRK